MRLGPDAARYWSAAAGVKVPRPFNLRWLLPRLLGHNQLRWWIAWCTGWLLMAAGLCAWRLAAGDSWPVVLTATALLLGLPGILGPVVTIPVGVDIPATGMALVAAALFELGWWWAALPAMMISASIRETTPVWAALWIWSPLPLIALAVPAAVHFLIPTGPDPLGEKFQTIADHPIRSAIAAHSGRWRDGWLMVAPWGICLAALYSPSWPLVVVLGLAYAQLLVATDTVRLVQHAAGPAMAVAAAQTIPPQWLLLAVAGHVVWWRTPERV